MKTWAAVVAALGVLAVGATATHAGWASARVQNATSSTRTGALAITHAYAGGPCGLTARVSSVSCPGGLGTTAGPPSTRADTIAAGGSLAVAQTVSAASCGVVQFANATSSTDPMLPRNAVAFRQTDAWGGTAAAAFSGSGYATDVVGTGGGGLLGLLQKSYSFGVWFNAADTKGGGLISLDASLSNASSATADPALWLDSSGHVAFAGSGTLGPVTGASPGTYTSGWHFAVLTVNTTGVLTLTKSITLYVDGTSVATASGLTLLTSTSGYWHLGWADFTGLTAPTSSTFHGSLTGAFVNSATTLSAGQVSALYTAGSASSYRITLSGQTGIASIWMLDDNGWTTTSATMPSTLANACAKVNVTLTFTTPNVTIGPLSLAAFADGSVRAAGTIPVGGSQSLSIATVTGSGYSTDLAGLHLYVPITFAYGSAPWQATMAWGSDPGQVFWA